MKEDVTIRKHHFMIALLVPLIVILTGAALLGGCSRKQVDVAVPAVEKEETEHPDANLADIKIGRYTNPEALISVYELKEKLLEPQTIVIDTRGTIMRIYQATYLAGHIPGAVAILYSSLYNQAYPGRIANPMQLQDILGQCGVNNKSCIILYGKASLNTRLYWAIKMYGHDKVRIMDGNLDKWEKAGYDITNIPVKRARQDFTFDLTKATPELMLATMQEVEPAAGAPDYVIVDARSNHEYAGGHIPGSVNIPWSELLGADTAFRPAFQLKQLFQEQGITPDKNIIVYANAGIRSTTVWFVLSELMGYPNVKNYDGSYNEWQKYERRVETGTPE